MSYISFLYLYYTYVFGYNQVIFINLEVRIATGE